MFDTKKDLPQPALYRSSFEHDNCGIGAVVNMKGIKTHKTVCRCVEHRRKPGAPCR